MLAYIPYMNPMGYAKLQQSNFDPTLVIMIPYNPHWINWHARTPNKTSTKESFGALQNMARCHERSTELMSVPVRCQWLLIKQSLSIIRDRSNIFWSWQISLKSPGILLKGLLLKVAILAKRTDNFWQILKKTKKPKTTENKQSTHCKTLQKQKQKKTGNNGTNSTEKNKQLTYSKEKNEKMNEKIEQKQQIRKMQQTINILKKQKIKINKSKKHI